MAEIFLIKKPAITEKAARLAESRKYVFIVAPHATKPEIKKAVKEAYKVDAIAVNIINLPAKLKRYGQGPKSAVGGARKAIVTLKEGQKLDIK